jgi:AAA domain/Bifunctional DNA primase/polymerase, N-terminal
MVVPLGAITMPDDLAPLDARLRLAANDYSPIPLSGKKPIVSGWQTWHHRSRSDIESWEWSYRDHVNTGVLTAENPFLDLDIYNEPAAQAAEELVAAEFDGQYLPLRVGQPPKRGFLFQLVGEPFEKIVVNLIAPNDTKTHKIELLAAGQQVVVHGIHPDTRRPYEWFGGSPFDLPRSDLPGITAEAAQALVDRVVALLITEFGFQLQKPKTGNGHSHGNFDWSTIHSDPIDHDAIVSAAMAMMVAGLHDGAAYNFFEAQIKHAPAGDEARRQRRLDELPDIIKSARAKIDPHKTKGPAPPQLKIMKPLGNFATLRTRIFPPIKFIVPGYIAEGCTLIAGNPKIGKSWLALEIGLAVATGGTCLGGIQCEQGNVLFLALEDNERRLQSRGTKLAGYASADEWPAALDYHTEWPRAEEGGLESIAAWINSVPNPRLVLIDVLMKFRSPPQRKDMTPYEADYRALEGAQGLSSKTGVGIAVFHHSRKSASDSDPFERVSGTFGLTGAADTVFVLDRSGQGTTFYGRGRDVDEIESAVRFDKETCRWKVLGEATEVHRSDERRAIIDLLKGGKELSAQEIADLTGQSLNATRAMLTRMVQAGEVIRPKAGRYTVYPL